MTTNASNRSQKQTSPLTVTLRFVEERTSGTGNPVEVVLPPAIPWDEVCRRLRLALRRVAIFRCSDGLQGWREVCNDSTYTEFRDSILQRFASHSNGITLEAHVIPIGSGALPLWTSEETASLAGAGSGGQLADTVLREGMQLTKCVDRAIAGGSEAEKQAAQEARRIVELAEAAAAVGTSAQQEEVCNDAICFDVP
jgi:hypothetical protein